MTCINIQENFIDFLTNDLLAGQKQEVLNHLQDCDDCREELQEITQLWTNLGVLPEISPSKNMRNDFYKKLEQYKVKEPMSKPSTTKNQIRGLFRFLTPNNPIPQLAMIIFLVIAGFGLGNLFTLKQDSKIEINALKSEVNSMQNLLALTLINQKSSSDRLLGVNQTTKINNPDSILLNVLFKTLNTDPNTNVRLATLNTLYTHRQSSEVRNNIYQSLLNQDSPLVQLSLIDMIAELPSIESINCLKNFLNKNTSLGVPRFLCHRHGQSYNHRIQ